MISILLPTRNRPKRVETLIQSVFSSAEGPVEVLLYIDEDDLATKQVLQKYDPKYVRWFVGPKPKFLSDTYNALYPMARGEILGYAADDIAFSTRGWDSKISAAFAEFPDEIALVYPGANDEVPLHGFVSKKACEVLGYFLPPHFEHGYADYWIWDIYRSLGRSKGCLEIKVIHEHWHSNSELFDSVYHERSIAKDEAGTTCDDRDKVVFDGLHQERLADAAKLRAFFTETQMTNDNQLLFA